MSELNENAPVARPAKYAKPVLVTMTPEMHAGISGLAAQRNLYVTDIIREALSREISNNPNQGRI